MSGSIKGNLIGLDATGTAAQANGHGIDVGGNVTIGGVTADERNVLSGNTFQGLGLGPGAIPARSTATTSVPMHQARERYRMGLGYGRMGIWETVPASAPRQ